MRINFGRFVLDTGREQLFVTGSGLSEVQLTPKAFGVLRLLVERRPDVVDKDTIAGTVWGAPVSDASLTMVMAELRKALGDSAATPAYIRTAHRRGYAFCGRAEPAGETRDEARFFLVIGGDRFALRDGDTIAGRDEACGVRLDEPSVSRRHARFIVSADTVTVEDLESTNGTLVNGKRARAATALHAGDTIKIGGVKARFDAPHASRSGKTVRLPGR
ncbi:MAG: FHA domain-containing protein [Acidobacteriota bacterium]|nr:FHA domain-containing protein [Acidobacteriota bacterium]